MTDKKKYYDTIDKDVLNKYAPGIDADKPLVVITDLLLDDIGGELDDEHSGYYNKVAFPGWYQVSEIGIGIREKSDPDNYIMIRWDDIQMVIQDSDVEEMHEDLEFDDDDDDSDVPGGFNEDELIKALKNGGESE